VLPDGLGSGSGGMGHVKERGAAIVPENPQTWPDRPRPGGAESFYRVRRFEGAAEPDLPADTPDAAE
jgi:hypothetical protein